MNAMVSEVPQSVEPTYRMFAPGALPCTAATSSDCSPHQPYSPPQSVRVGLRYAVDARRDDLREIHAVCTIGVSP